MTKKSFVGAAPATALTAAINSAATSLSVSSIAGYPSTTGGPFVICVDRGTSSEEKMLVSATATGTFTVSTRGYDNTTATSHAAGATVEHVLDANTIAEANDHVNTTTRDDHTQYLNAARHDVSARHTFGAALGTPGAPAAVGTTAAAGTGAVPARADHVHVLGSGSVASAGLFVAGVVDASALATDAVTTVKIAANAVTTAKLAAGAVTATQIATDAVGSAQIAADAVGSSEIAADAVTSSELAASAVTGAKIASGAVSRDKLASGFTGVTVGTTAPTSPVEGEVFYDTTNDRLVAYTTATTGWVAPWNLPWGAIDYQASTSSQTVAAGSAGTETSLTGLSSTLTYVANRRVKVRLVLLNLQGTVSGDILLIKIKEGSTQLSLTTVTVPATNGYVPITAEVVLSPAAGAHTYTATIQRYSGTGGWSTGAGAGQAAYLLVEDLGNVGAPA